ncbi:MAG: RecX family transcriptional regulator [Coriobacteriia bacterium]|nr:RecX family transcriptional regulator [Coriobacteriia bacterium]
MPTVTDIRAPRRGSKVRVIVLDDAEWRATSIEVLAPLGVRVGDPVDPDELAGRLERAEPGRARERALRLLSFKERSAHEVRKRLVDDGYCEDVSASVVADLERSGLVDDERFARVLARSLTEIRGLGGSRVLRELAAKGVDADLARRALDEFLPPDAEAAAAAEMAARLALRADARTDRIAGRLVRKGFAPALALRASRDAMAHADGESVPEGGEYDLDEHVDLHERTP